MRSPAARGGYTPPGGPNHPPAAAVRTIAFASRLATQHERFGDEAFLRSVAHSV